MVEDLVAGIRLPKVAAATTVEREDTSFSS
jgi:hypothetical protein